MLNTISLVAGLMILVVMAVVATYFYLTSKHQELMEEWYVLRDKLRLRLDRLPLVLELFRNAVPGETALVHSVIEVKSKVWPPEKPTSDVVHKHLDLTEKLKSLFEVAAKHETLKHNLVFLSAKKDLQAINDEIEGLSEPYNERVRKLNHMMKFPLVKPLVLLFKLKKFPIFEFEP